MRKGNRLIAFISTFLSFFFLLSAFSGKAANSANRIRQENQTPVLTALADPEEDPYFSIKEGEQIGIIPELVSLLSNATGYQIKILDDVASYDDYEKHLKAKDYDLLLDASSLTPAEYISGYDFSDTFLSASYSKVTLKKSTSTSKKIAAVGAYSASGLYARTYYYEEQLTSFDTMASCLDAVKNGTCYAAVINTIYAQQIFNSDVRNTFAVTKLSDDSFPLKIGVKQDGTGKILTAINAGIASISAETYNAVVSRYSHFIFPTVTFWDQVYLNPAPYLASFIGISILLITILITAAVLSHRRTITKANREYARFIAYVCQTNDSVYEVNTLTKTKNQYQIVDGKIKNITSSYSPQNDFLSLLHPDDLPAVNEKVTESNLNKIISDGSQMTFEARIRKDNGQYYWTYCIFQGIKPNKTQPANYMVYIRSIDEEKQKDAQAKTVLQNAVNQAEMASHSKSDFLARMSHEIRTPLNAIIGLDNIARYYENDKAKVDDCLVKIDSSSKVLLNLINDILDMSAIENNKMKIAMADFSLAKVISDLNDIYSPQCKEKNIEFNVKASIPDKIVIGDELRVSQILLNLVSNSFKFTAEHGRISLEVKRTSIVDGKVYYRFIESDTGLGMSEEMKKRLFQPFEQENAETAKKYGGSGLGLSIVKSLVTMMGGSISVASELNKGTTFIVDMPFGYKKNSSRKGEENFDKRPLKQEKYDFGHIKVLLAEDNEINREIAVELFKMVNVETDCAANGQEAVEKFAATKPGYYKAVFLDVQMPIMNGYEACRQIRKLPREDAKTTPVFAMTANAFSEDVSKAISAGMNGHIAKPIDSNNLYRVLDEAISESPKNYGGTVDDD